MAIFNSYVKLPEGIYAWTDFSGLIGTWILIPDTWHPPLFQGRGPSVPVPERCLRSKRACDNILVVLNATFGANSCQITDFLGGRRFWAIAKSCPSCWWCKQISTKRTQVFELTAIEISDDSSKLGTTKLDRPLDWWFGTWILFFHNIWE